MQKAKRTKRLLGRLILLILIFSIALTGCTEGDGIDTFIKATSGPPEMAGRADAKSDTRFFDINDVTLTFYFGIIMSPDIEFERENGNDYGIAELYFENDDGDRRFIRRTEEPFTSEEYRRWTNKDGTLVYNHSETLTIPAELFTKPVGEVGFWVYAQNSNIEDRGMEIVAGIRLFYRIAEDEKVELRAYIPFE